MHTSDIIGKKYLRAQAFLTGAAFVVSAAVIGHSPDIPFDRRLAPLLAVSSVGYFAFAALWPYILGDLRRAVMALSLFGIAVMGFVVHMTGGIISPLVCFYFALLVSEVGYGVTSPVSIYASVASYLCVVLGEWSGLLGTVNPHALAIYGDQVAFIFIVSSVVSFMLLTGHIGKLILTALRKDFADEQAHRRALQEKFSEISSMSHIGALAHRIVHDLRGPLGAILGYGDLLLRSPSGSPEDKELLGEMLHAVEGVGRSLTDVTRFGRSGGQVKEEVSLPGFFRNLLGIFKFDPSCGGVNMKFEHDSKGEPRVFASRQDLQQVYFNIIKNAAEAVSGMGKDESVAVGISSDQDAALVQVEHNGPHIPKEVLDSLFLRPVTGKENGTGVGMLIAKDLLKRNGGEIRAENLPGGGVRVITRFPLVSSP